MKNDKLSISHVTRMSLLCMTCVVWPWARNAKARAAEETCGSCTYNVSVSGDFTHREEDPAIRLQGAASNAAAFREDISGESFSVSVSNLPEGRYTLVIGLVETSVSEPGERVFDVTSGDVTLAKNFDIVSAAGGVGKVYYVRGTVDHLDDALRGPLKVTFTAIRNNAKFNTFEVQNASDALVLGFNASEIAEPFTAQEACRRPDSSDVTGGESRAVA
jgi:hypothetical protein